MKNGETGKTLYTIFTICIDRRRCPYRPTRMFVSTDADVRIDRRRCPYRPTRMSVSTDADGKS
ncbi:hypothetical protein [Leyella stercorea]|uniref:hypothetical protein n=1 Tax=Leyella stercorea TaxID=363265 RepID=UPI00243107E4|nr:hypothetical protein [Leyella stercorea]